MSGENQKIEVPIGTWVEDVIDRALQKHENRCPLRQRVEKLELKLGTLLGFMAGSGLLGGVVGGLITRAIGG